jgi:hypothetical protein
MAIAVRRRRPRARNGDVTLHTAFDGRLHDDGHGPAPGWLERPVPVAVPVRLFDACLTRNRGLDALRHHALYGALGRERNPHVGRAGALLDGTDDRRVPEGEGARAVIGKRR